MKRLPQPIIWIGAMCLVVVGMTQQLSAAPPNVVVILADDMGFSDIGPYGSEIPTPHLDTLAKNGLQFSQFYNTGRCCPTRATLLTGLYAHETGIGWMTSDQQLPGYRGHLNHQCVTIAEVLGKVTGCSKGMGGSMHICSIENGFIGSVPVYPSCVGRYRLHH